MRTQRKKRSEKFWPAIVMKKWLNIAPKVYDFSEDEVDTESEDDVCSLKDERMDHDVGKKCNLQSVCHNQTLGKQGKGYTSRHRRGKSETLRAQYINTKDVRVRVGTWNVAGRLPDANLEIDEWLQMEEPADIYILGFQEVVPLNAGNVLGAENRQPIPKWEAIIRRTLNKSSETETRPKSFSAPPSPVLRTSSVVDMLADVDDASLEEVVEEAMNTNKAVDDNMIGLGNHLQLKRMYGIDRAGSLEWPERPLDLAPQSLSSSLKLRRVFSSSARVGAYWLDEALTSGTQNPSAECNKLKRVRHSSGNLGSMWMDQPDFLDVINSISDDSEHASDEEDDSFPGFSDDEQESLPVRDMVKQNQKYVRIISKQMVGIYVSIWVRKRLRRRINNLEVSPVGVGLMGYLGNKGSVSVSMSLYQTRLCFVCSHLSSGQKEGAEERRNSDVFEILKRTHFSSAMETDKPLTIPSHDRIFWFGDLNYRINMVDEEVRKLAVSKKWDELLNCDQLCKELQCGHVFDGWKEGIINFAPTYKYEFDSDKYAGENAKEGEKKRSPAWCDRILWLGKGIRQLSYNRAELTLSDHRPVSSMFVVEVEIFDQRKLQKALHANTAAVHPEMFLAENEDPKYTS